MSKVTFFCRPLSFIVINRIIVDVFLIIGGTVCVENIKTLIRKVFVINNWTVFYLILQVSFRRRIRRISRIISIVSLNPHSGVVP